MHRHRHAVRPGHQGHHRREPADQLGLVAVVALPVAQGRVEAHDLAVQPGAGQSSAAQIGPQGSGTAIGWIEALLPDPVEGLDHRFAVPLGRARAVVGTALGSGKASQQDPARARRTAVSPGRTTGSPTSAGRTRRERSRRCCRRPRRSDPRRGTSGIRRCRRGRGRGRGDRRGPVRAQAPGRVPREGPASAQPRSHVPRVLRCASPWPYSFASKPLTVRRRSSSSPDPSWSSRTTNAVGPP